MMNSLKHKNRTFNRLTASFLMIVLLCVCLAVTTYALVMSIVTVEDNLFVTGTVKINLNDGKAVISEDEFLFEPGVTVKKDFFLKNESSCDVYYKLYFSNVSGDLANILDVTICDGETVLFKGTPQSLNRKAVSAADDVLHLNEQKDLQIYFHFPEEAGNEAQHCYLTFDFAADAVQTKNNTFKEFE